MILREIIVVVFLSTTLPAEGSELNRLVDIFVAVAVKEIKAKGGDEKFIGTLEGEFKKGWGAFSVTGHFEGTNGWLRSMTSLRRTGDARIGLERDGITLEVAFGLGHLEAGFPKYSTRFGIINLHGQMGVSVGNNSISFEILLNYRNGSCTTELRKVKVDRLEDVRLHLTGLGKLNKLYSHLSTWILNRSKSRIVESVETEIFSSLQDALEKYNICKELEPQLSDLTIGNQDPTVKYT